LEKTSISLENTIDEYSKSIETYKLDKKFKIYSLIEINKKNLDILEKNSKVTNFLEHLNYIKSTYDLDFRGFNFNNSLI
jgi:hypothetical protein